MDLLAPPLVAGVSALLSAALFGAYRALAGSRMGQRHRDQGPAHHKVKGRVPTGAGIVVVLLLALGGLLSYLLPPYSGPTALLGTYVCVAAALMGLVGWVDDYRKVRYGSAGLKARFKFPVMLLCGAVLLVLLRLYFNQLAGDPGIAPEELPWPALAPAWLYYSVGMFVWLGALNGANFTDGLDGLLDCTTLVTLAGVFYALLDGVESLSTPAAIGLGAMLAYLFYNWKPAKLYVGDSGSLAVGALIGGMFLAKGWWLFLGLAAVVWVLEVLSVVIQVAYFRRTGGKRLLLMSPLHHHFELAGWSELTVVYVFTALQAFGCAVAFVWLRYGTLAGLAGTFALALTVALLLYRYHEKRTG